MCHLWEKEGKKRKEKGKEGKRNRKVKEGRKKEFKKERRTERKKVFRGKGEKKKSSAGFKLVRLVLLVFLSVKREGVVGRIDFTFLPS